MKALFLVARKYKWNQLNPKWLGKYLSLVAGSKEERGQVLECSGGLVRCRPQDYTGQASAYTVHNIQYTTTNNICTMYIIHCPIYTLDNTSHTLAIAQPKVLIRNPSYISLLYNTFYSPSATTNIAPSWSRQKNVTRDLEISSRSYFSTPEINSLACKVTQIQINLGIIVFLRYSSAHGTTANAVRQTTLSILVPKMTLARPRDVHDFRHV